MIPRSCRLPLGILVTLLVSIEVAHCTNYFPSDTRYTEVSYNVRNSPMAVFPNNLAMGPCTTPWSRINYFISELNLEASSGNILVGAANKLYLLNQITLECLSELNWNTSQSKIAMCNNIIPNNMEEVFTCHNHIRVYKAIPTTTDLLLVCGSQAIVDPQCRIVNISGNILTAVGDPVDAADGVVSYYPAFAGFGDFIRDDSTKYFGVGYYQGTRGVGRNYRMAFYNVNPAENGNTSQIISSQDDDSWLKSPFTLMDYYKADYPNLTDQVLSQVYNEPRTSSIEDYQFYFVFVRENVASSNSEVIQSQVVRICRNDPGLMNGDFSTFMKARISCMIQVPSAREFNGANDYVYNNIDSMAFNRDGPVPGGRYSQNQPWREAMYGAFSGPLVGPKGSAICIYPAGNTRQVSPMSQSDRGIFDIFREDLILNGNELQNNFLECPQNGRPSNVAIYLDILQDIKQISDNPILLLQGITVTKMVVDQVCVFARSGTECSNQDILFLGTSEQKVIKMTFASIDSSSDTEPVYSEIINLDNGDDSTGRVRALRIETIDSEKKIFVSTDSRVYQLPIERCSRLETCRECVGARDPYCVWDTDMSACVSNSFSVEGMGNAVVNDSRFVQNVHDGYSSVCDMSSECTVRSTLLSAREFVVIVENCNGIVASVAINVSSSSLTPRDCGEEGRMFNACVIYSGALGRQNYEVTVDTTEIGNTPGSRFRVPITTPDGPPAPVSEDQIIATPGQTSLEICIQLNTFTASFSSYSFLVSYGNMSSSLDQKTLPASLSTTTCRSLTELNKPGSIVNYRVDVSNSEGNTFSEVYRVPLLEDIPGPIFGVPRLIDRTSSSISLTWDPPTMTNGNITGYALNVNGKKEIACVLQPLTSYTVDGLQPYTQYNFTVQACNGAGESSESQAATYTTLCEPPGPVGAISFPSPSDSSLDIQWSIPSIPRGEITQLGYNVNITCYDSDMGAIDAASLSVSEIGPTSRTVVGLSPLTTCCVTVRAYHIGPDCTITDPGPGLEQCGTTIEAVPDAVTNLATVAVSTSTIFVSWENPLNYQTPGLTYFLSWTSRNGGGTGNVTDETVYYIVDLQPLTQYNVSVFAMGSLSSGETTSQIVSTLALPPDPPLRPTLAVSGDIVTMNWTPVSSPGQNIVNYATQLRCNHEVFEMVVPYPNTTAVFNTSSVPGFVWCSGVVQSIAESQETSRFSSFASMVRQNDLPTRPQCYYAGSEGTIAGFSFTVSDPFDLEQLMIEYHVYTDQGQPIINQTRNFIMDSLNIVNVTVDRGHSYSFELRFCNLDGCGDYCDRITFNHETEAPSPPETISLTSIDCCSVAVNWTAPPNERNNSLLYTLQLTSSCPTTGRLFEKVENRFFEFKDLCPDTQYVVTIRVMELTTNLTGVYGLPFEFSTPPGIPSAPGNLRVRANEALTNLTFNWESPEFPMGGITSYDILFYNTVEECDKQNAPAVYHDSVGGNVTQYETSNVSALKLPEDKILTVCVRARNSMFSSSWAFFTTTNAPMLGGLGDGSSSPITACTNLIIVAAIACVAVLSTIVLGLILILVICWNGWTPLKTYKDRWEEKRVEDYPHRKEPVNRTLSTSSQTPMLKNGTYI